MISLGFLTDTGVTREVNEDRLGLWRLDISQNKSAIIEDPIVLELEETDTIVLAVADGMGGTDKGEYASNKVIELLDELLKKEFSNVDALVHDLKDFFTNANKTLLESKKYFEENVSFGTTLSIGLVHQNELHMFWIGDSRIYGYAKNLEVLIEEHTVVWDLFLNKKITKNEVWDHPESYIITKCLGLNEREIVPGYEKIKLKNNHRVLICSDGINSMMPDYVLEYLFEQKLETQSLVKLLIDVANQAGGLDNSTVILMDKDCSFQLKNTSVITQTAIDKIKDAKLGITPKTKFKKYGILGAAIVISLIAMLFFTQFKTHSCIESSVESVKHKMSDVYMIQNNKANIIKSIDKLHHCVKSSNVNKLEDVKLILSDIQRMRSNVELFEQKEESLGSGLSSFELIKSEFENIEKSIKYIHDKN